MQEDEIRKLQSHTKIMDNRTGEELYYLSFSISSQYVVCSDGKNIVWLTPDRIEIIK